MPVSGRDREWEKAKKEYDKHERLFEKQGFERGFIQGQNLVIRNIIFARFGFDEELSAIVSKVLEIPIEEYTPLLVQLSRDELLARFSP